MSEREPDAARPRRQGFWVTLGEVVGVLALVIAGLNFWETHRQHQDDVRREQAQTRASSAFVVVGEADRDGRSVGLRPLKASQAIQSERYRFPGEVLDHPVEIAAERPRIQADWVIPGLRRVLEAAHASGAGAARIPVVIETVYVEDGDTRTDVSLYQLGVAWKHGFFSGRQIRLTGVALSHRQVAGDTGAILQARWAAARSTLAAP